MRLNLSIRAIEWNQKKEDIEEEEKRAWMEMAERALLGLRLVINKDDNHG